MYVRSRLALRVLAALVAGWLAAACDGSRHAVPAPPATSSRPGSPMASTSPHVVRRPCGAVTAPSGGFLRAGPFGFLGQARAGRPTEVVGTRAKVVFTVLEPYSDTYVV